MGIFTPKNPSIVEICGYIKNQYWALPNFQRSWEWKPELVVDLLASVVHAHPIGSILTMRYRNDSFEPRGFEGGPNLEGDPHVLVLDGQQRLTALFQSLMGVGRYRYYIKWKEYLDSLSSSNPCEIEDLIKYQDTESKNRRCRRYDLNTEFQVEDQILPFGCVGPEGAFWEWSRNYRRCYLNRLVSSDADAKLNASESKEQELMELYEKLANKMRQYQIPEIELSDKVDLDGVCTVFYKVNTKNVRLSTFDLLAAKHYPSGLRLREMKEDALVGHPIIKDFDIDPYYLLQIIALHLIIAEKDAEKTPKSCTRGRILKLKAKEIGDYWHVAVKGLADVLEILREDCGILCHKVLPSGPMLLPMAAVWPKTEGMEKRLIGDCRSKVLQWFWGSIVANRYSSSANTHAVEDTKVLWGCLRGEKPEISESAYLGKETLRGTTPTQGILYKGMMALVLKNAKDFYRGGRISTEMLLSGKAEDHHIFPKSNLEKDGVGKDLRNCILNRTYISNDTNRIIGNNRPSVYWNAIVDERLTNDISKDRARIEGGLDSILESHHISTDSPAHIKNDNFDAFLLAREEDLLNLLSDASKIPMDRLTKDI